MYDQKLVEASARAAFEDLKGRLGAERIGQSWETLAPNLREDWLSSARAVLAAIDASGTHLVVPVKCLTQVCASQLYLAECRGE